MEEQEELTSTDRLSMASLFRRYLSEQNAN